MEYWSYNDFLTLLFIYCAKSDLDFSEDEKEAIINKVGEEEFKKVDKEFKKLSDFEITELIHSLGQKYCPGENEKCKVIDDLNDIIHVDGRESQFEEEMVRLIKKIM